MAIVAVGYKVSRGLAKAGSRDPYWSRGSALPGTGDADQTVGRDRWERTREGWSRHSSRRAIVRVGAGVLRALAIGFGIALIFFALTARHVIVLPLLFIPFGLFSFGHRQNRRRRGWW